MTTTETAALYMTRERLASFAGRASFEYVGDDAYDRSEVRTRQGWKLLSAWGEDGWDLGNWPYLMFYVRKEPNGSYSLASDAEGDWSTWTFESHAELTQALTYLAVWDWLGDPQWHGLTDDLEHVTRESLDAGTARLPERLCKPYGR